MKLSQRRVTDLYTAMHDPIMELRIKFEQREMIVTDSVLFDLEQSIWRGIAKVLDINPA